jgi:hypothetical protein
MNVCSKGLYPSYSITGLGRPLGIQEVNTLRISRQSAYWCDNFVSPTHWPLLPQEISLVFLSVRGWVDPWLTVWPEELIQWKISMTTWEIEPATFRLIAQCLSLLRHLTPPKAYVNPWKDILIIHVDCVAEGL